MIYGYARVSTKGQARDGNSLEYQERILRENGATEIYADSFTGTAMDRPELNKLLSKIQEGDTLIVTKLDRIARSAAHGSEIVSGLLKRGVKVHILNMGVIDSTPVGKLIWQIFFAFAEFERDMIVERTQEGKAIARLNPEFTEGRPQLEIPEFPAYMKKVREGKMTKTEAAKALNISRQTWYNMEKRYA
jgi:DNA invertase Pin-like site-specific DNA recombinase